MSATPVNMDYLLKLLECRDRGGGFSDSEVDVMHDIFRHNARYVLRLGRDNWELYDVMKRGRADYKEVVEYVKNEASLVISVNTPNNKYYIIV